MPDVGYGSVLMRRPQPAFGFAAVIAGLLAVTSTPALVHASRAIEQEVDVATSTTPREAAGRWEASVRSGLAVAPSQSVSRIAPVSPSSGVEITSNPPSEIIAHPNSGIRRHPPLEASPLRSSTAPARNSEIAIRTTAT